MYLIPAQGTPTDRAGAGLMIIIAQPALFRNNFFLIWPHFLSRWGRKQYIYCKFVCIHSKSQAFMQGGAARCMGVYCKSSYAGTYPVRCCQFRLAGSCGVHRKPVGWLKARKWAARFRPYRLFRRGRWMAAAVRKVSAEVREGTAPHFTISTMNWFRSAG